MWVGLAHQEISASPEVTSSVALSTESAFSWDRPVTAAEEGDNWQSLKLLPLQRTSVSVTLHHKREEVHQRCWWRLLPNYWSTLTACSEDIRGLAFKASLFEYPQKVPSRQTLWTHYFAHWSDFNHPPPPHPALSHTNPQQSSMLDLSQGWPRDRGVADRGWKKREPAKCIFHTLTFAWCACVCWVAQLCLTFCDSMDCSSPGSSVHGIVQARILEWVAISSSRGSSRPRDQTQVSCIAGGFFTIWATRGALIKPWNTKFVMIVTTNQLEIHQGSRAWTSRLRNTGPRFELGAPQVDRLLWEGRVTS